MLLAFSFAVILAASTAKAAAQKRLPNFKACKDVVPALAYGSIDSVPAVRLCGSVSDRVEVSAGSTACFHAWRVTHAPCPQNAKFEWHPHLDSECGAGLRFVAYTPVVINGTNYGSDDAALRLLAAQDYSSRPCASPCVDPL